MQKIARNAYQRTHRGDKDDHVDWEDFVTFQGKPLQHNVLIGCKLRCP